MKNIVLYHLAIAAIAVTMTSCASKKAVAQDSTHIASQTTTIHNNDETAEKAKDLSFVKKVFDNNIQAKAISAKLDFSLSAGGKDISASGNLRMKRDQVIRLQLSAFGLFEVGRLEFTPEYVLIVDRIHKQYIKESYSRVAFLQRNGITFYTLQALFWNQLFLPGVQHVDEKDLKAFDTNANTLGNTTPLYYKNGHMQYSWQADKLTGLISTAGATYSDAAAGTSKLSWQYSGFQAFGNKRFPSTQVVTITTDALKKYKSATMMLKLSGIGDSDNWETYTQVSDKYAKVDAEELLKQIMKM